MPASAATAVRPAFDSKPFVGFAFIAASSGSEPIVRLSAKLVGLAATQASPFRRSMATQFDPMANWLDLSVAKKKTYFIFRLKLIIVFK